MYSQVNRKYVFFLKTFLVNIGYCKDVFLNVNRVWNITSSNHSRVSKPDCTRCTDCLFFAIDEKMFFFHQEYVSLFGNSL